MSVYRVGVSRYTETRESGYRVGVCRYTDPDPVGIPTPPESVARHSETGIPTLPRGAGDYPQKVVIPIYRYPPPLRATPVPTFREKWKVASFRQLPSLVKTPQIFTYGDVSFN